VFSELLFIIHRKLQTTFFVNWIMSFRIIFVEVMNNYLYYIHIKNTGVNITNEFFRLYPSWSPYLKIDIRIYSRHSWQNPSKLVPDILVGGTHQNRSTINTFEIGEI